MRRIAGEFKENIRRTVDEKRLSEPISGINGVSIITAYALELINSLIAPGAHTFQVC